MQETMTASEDGKGRSRPSLSAQQQNGGKDDPTQTKPNVRKRTKTGCLTCRKRRIKCDEGRPTCNNCIKSKRHCEGYNQRVVFKNPMGSLQGLFGAGVYPPGAVHLTSHLAHPNRSPSQGPLPVIAPKPSSEYYQQPQQQPGQQYGQSFLGAPSHAHPPCYAQPQENFPYGAYSTQPNPLAPSVYVESTGQPDLGEFSAIGPPGYPPTNASYLPMNPSFDASMLTTIPQQGVTWESRQSEDEESIPESDNDEASSRGLVIPMANQFPAIWNGHHAPAFSTFAQNNVLSEYINFPESSELRDRGMRTSFLHFIKVTGPSMSLYERKPPGVHRNESSGGQSQTGHSPWSYTFPVMSLQHPGLLHAILALGSLQIAKLQNIPATAAIKHYQLAIRRIAKNVRSPLRRTQPATIAATLLVAYFEVWSSDLTKWCTHLFGASILFREVPLRAMSCACLPYQRQQARAKALRNHFSFTHGLFAENTTLDTDATDLNYQLLTTLTGSKVAPEDYGLQDFVGFDELPRDTTQKDLERYENLRDLFWWYCKMDVYQSFLGGTKLFMGYQYWTQCPPRAPLSRSDAVYGTYDHLILLLGRLADFSSRDLARKSANSKGFFSAAYGGSPPSFPGILPTYGKFDVPMGFSPPKDTSPQGDFCDGADPHPSLQSALAEWENIRQAFDAFERNLSIEFQPLKPDYANGRDSPFGSTLQYRSFSIAGIWMNYYMGLIHLHRRHPNMPPAAHTATVKAARKTAGFSAQVGRIAAGLSGGDCSQVTEVTTLVGAAFIESAFCLFVAAVQYEDNDQRRWVVQRMHDISRLTGWQSAKQIADGCESGWLKAAQLGRGPSYVRYSGQTDTPVSIWQNPRRLDRKIHELDSADDKRLVLAKSERAHYALGLLGVEHDLEVLELKDEC